MNTKNLRIKAVDEAAGKVSAVFATLNVKDHDGDVTLPGAFKEGAEVRISAYNHASWQAGQLPVGKGTIHYDGDEVLLEGQFFMDTASGRDTFTTVKELGSLGEWSYGFDVIEAESGTHDGEDVQFLKALDVHEVSPVILGAGLGTRTVAAKSRNLQFKTHIAAVMAEVEVLTDRAADVMAKRQEKDKTISEESRKALEEVESKLTKLKEVLTPDEPPAEPNDNLEARAALERSRTLLR